MHEIWCGCSYYRVAITEVSETVLGAEELGRGITLKPKKTGYRQSKTGYVKRIIL